MLDMRVSKCLGVRLWLLKDPAVTWTDFAIALYNLQTEETDNTLMELKGTYLPSTGKNIYRLRGILEQYLKVTLIEEEEDGHDEC